MEKTRPDIKELYIPNICFSLFKGLKAGKNQRLNRGFDDSELIYLYRTFAAFMLPRLTAYLELEPSIQHRNKKSVEKLVKFYKACKLMVQENFRPLMEAEIKQVHEGIEVMGDVFLTLWLDLLDPDYFFKKGIILGKKKRLLKE